MYGDVIEHKENISEPILITLRRSIFAGVCISIGGTVYLTLGNVIGAFLFSFGLLAVIHCKLPLFTGKCGFCKTIGDLKQLPLILSGNILGAFFTALCIRFSLVNLVNNADKILLKRADLNIFDALILPVFCGIIMTVVVRFARKNKFLPLLIGIPLFIICGFIHSIADAFYYSMSSFDLFIKNIPFIVFVYLFAIIGNFIGCIIPNIFVYGSIFDLSKE